MELYIADSTYSMTCNVNKTVKINSSKEIFVGRNKVGYNDFYWTKSKEGAFNERSKLTQ